MASFSPVFLESAGIRNVLTQEQCSLYTVDGVEPGAVVLPSTVNEVSQVLTLASREGIRVTPYGGGTQMDLGNTPNGVDLVVGISSLNRMVDHQPSDLTATVEAGMTLAKAQAKLAKAGQFLPLEAPCPEKATIGGILATAYSGPLSLAYGLPRDWLIGIKVVNADGTVTKGGGKVVKNVTGYDMNKLYTGSLGTLGVIVEASFKLAPRPPVSHTMVVGFEKLGDAVKTASALLREYGGPSALTLVNGEVAARVQLEPKRYCLLALFQGREGVVKSKADRASRAAWDNGCNSLEELSSERGDDLWQRLIDLPWVGVEPPALSVRFSLLPSQTPGMVEALDSLEDPSLSHGFVADIGTGSVRSLWWAAEDASVPPEFVRRVTSLVNYLEGGWVIERCPSEIKRGLDVWGPPPDSMEVMRRIKATLDPAGLLNPGRFVGGV
ncbi:MAG: FAD-binding oxidoreductase [Dehalococcoidia bacterium]